MILVIKFSLWCLFSKKCSGSDVLARLSPEGASESVATKEALGGQELAAEIPRDLPSLWPVEVSDPLSKQSFRGDTKLFNGGKEGNSSCFKLEKLMFIHSFPVW